MTFDPAAPVTITQDDLASPGQRLAAAIGDGLLLGVPSVVVTFVLWWEGVDADGTPLWDVPLWFSVMTGVLFAGYEVVGTAVWGQTIGKHVLRIRVCSGRDLGRPGWIRAFKRWLLYVVVGFVPLVGGVLTMLVPLPLVWTHNRQGLHDKFADTLVLRDESVPWA